MFLVAYPFDLIHSGKASLADFLDGLVIFMETILIEVPGQMTDPELDQSLMLGIKFNLSCIFLYESEADRLGHDSLFGGSLSIKFVNEFKLEIKGKFCLVEVLWMGLLRLKDG